jgi:hypothetical protein
MAMWLTPPHNKSSTPRRIYRGLQEFVSKLSKKIAEKFFELERLINGSKQD